MTIQSIDKIMEARHGRMFSLMPSFRGVVSGIFRLINDGILARMFHLIDFVILSSEVSKAAF